MIPFRRHVALALDGGGIRGAMVAKALAVVEDGLGQSCHEMFQLTAGTSTGSIISAAIRVGIPAARIHDLYARLGGTIFRKTWRFYWPLARYKYSNKPLIAALRATVGERTMGDFWTDEQKVDMVFTVRDLVENRTRFVKPWKDEYKDWKVWKAVLCSCTVPGYFPVVDGRYVDGGVGTYANPAYIAAHEATFCLGWDPKDTTLISIGTGRSPGGLQPYEADRFLPLEWVRPLVFAIIAESTEHQILVVQQQFPDIDFRRFQLDLPSPIAMDDPSEIPELTRWGKKLGSMILNDEVDRQGLWAGRLQPVKSNVVQSRVARAPGQAPETELSTKEYDNLDLEIRRPRKGELVCSLKSPAGDCEQRLPERLGSLDVEQFLNCINRPRRDIVRNVRGTRPSDEDVVESIRTFGQQLFHGVLPEELRINYCISQRQSVQDDRGLRIRLHLTDVPDLALLPWEYLYDPRDALHVALDERSPLVRYPRVPTAIRPLAFSRLNMLVAIASPAACSKLDAEDEWGHLKGALANLEEEGHVSVERLPKPTVRGLLDELERGDYHILHFIGHGDWDPDRQEGFLLMEDDTPQGQKMSTGDLCTLLCDERSTLRLVVLNACKGAHTSPSDPFAGLAQGLIRIGIPAVIAMQFAITDRAAVDFSKEFYRSVANGYPIDASLGKARRTMFFGGHKMEWGIPVLFMRSPDGQIFRKTVEERGGTS